MFPFAPGFPSMPGLPTRMEVPFTIKGMRLSAVVERRGSRIYATLNLPTRIGLVELSVGVEEAPVRAALERAATSELARAARSFFLQGNAAALDQLASNMLPMLERDVLGLAGDAAIQDLVSKAWNALGTYGDASVGALMLPGPISTGRYEQTFAGDVGRTIIGCSKCGGGTCVGCANVGDYGLRPPYG